MTGVSVLSAGDDGQINSMVADQRRFRGEGYQNEGVFVGSEMASPFPSWLRNRCDDLSRLVSRGAAIVHSWYLQWCLPYDASVDVKGTIESTSSIDEVRKTSSTYCLHLSTPFTIIAQ